MMGNGKETLKVMMSSLTLGNSAWSSHALQERIWIMHILHQFCCNFFKTYSHPFSKFWKIKSMTWFFFYHHRMLPAHRPNPEWTWRKTRRRKAYGNYVGYCDQDPTPSSLYSALYCLLYASSPRFFICFLSLSMCIIRWP